MSKRDFGTIKSLLHFDYPYYGEAGDGLRDEASPETWERVYQASSAGNIAPYDVEHDPMFGWRCVNYPNYLSRIFGTNKHGTFNIDTAGEYEIEAFIKWGGNWGQIFSTIQTPAPPTNNYYYPNSYVYYDGYYSPRYFNGHTYAFIESGEYKEDAREVCKRLGGHLATINSLEEFNFLVSFNSWAWIDGAKGENLKDVSEVRLHNGETTDYSQYSYNGSGDYGELYIAGSYLYDNVDPTTTAQGFICEWDYLLPPNRYKYWATEEDSTLEEAGHTYLFVPAQMTWEDAQDFCKSIGGRLPIIKDAKTNKFIKALAYGYNIWLNYSDADTEGEWNSQLGNNVSRPIDYTNWASGQPTNDSNRNYAYMNSNGQWNDAATTDLFYFICEFCGTDNSTNADTPLHKNFDASFFQYGGHTLMFIPLSLTWEKAKAWCESAGGHLATSTSRGKNLFIKFMAQNQEIWLGGTNKTEEGTWQWVNGETLDYTNWYSGRPYNNASYNYLYLVNNGQWGDDTATTSRYFVCEWDDLRDFSKGIEFSLSSTTGQLMIYDAASDTLAVSDKKIIPNAWYHILVRIKDGVAKTFLHFLNYVKYNGHTFKVFNELRTWADAKAICEELGGHLATSTSAEKNAVLESMTLSASLGDGTAFWLGATDEEQEGVWRWITGETWSYTNWSGSEPSNSGGNENYLQMSSDGYWNDNTSTATGYFICEWDYELSNRDLLDDGDEYVSLTLPARIETPFLVWLGGYSGYMDEFVFRHSAGTGAPVVPTGPYKGTLNVSKVGGFGTGSDGDIFLSPPIYSNSYGLLSRILFKNLNGSYNLDTSASNEIEMFVKYPVAAYANKTLFNMDLRTTSRHRHYAYFGGHTFRFIPCSTTWENAKKFCEMVGGHLATATSQEKNNFLWRIVADGGITWLGFSCETEEEGWQWITGETWDYANWRGSTPSASTEHKPYIYYDVFEFKTKQTNINECGYWELDTSSSSHYFICEWDDERLPTDYFYYGGHTFRFINSAQTWENAQTFCEMMGGHLATSVSEEKNTFLTIVAKGNNVWLGLTDKDIENTWEWITGETVEYTNWEDNQPDGGEQQNFVYLNAAGKWDDYLGEAGLYFICEWDTIKTDDTNFYYCDGHAFKLCSDISANFNDAKEYCELMGGHLPTIPNAKKLFFLNVLLCIPEEPPIGVSLNRTWLDGVYDNENEVWTWGTGENWGDTLVSMNHGSYNPALSLLCHFVGENYPSLYSPNGTAGIICEWDTLPNLTNFDVWVDVTGHVIMRCGEAITGSSSKYLYDSTHGGGWTHVLIRIVDNVAIMYLDGEEAARMNVPSMKIIPDWCSLGRNSFNSDSFIDSFSFRHTAGTGLPSVPLMEHSTLTKVQHVLNTNAIIASVDTEDARVLTIGSWCSGVFAPRVGDEVMIHVTRSRDSENKSYPYTGLYAFARITAINGATVALDRIVSTQYDDDFNLDNELISTYYVQLITVPNFRNVRLNNVGTTIIPNPFNTTTGGGIVAFRCSGDCTIDGPIITSGYGVARTDLTQMENSKLIDKFLFSSGGGVFITCGGTFTASDTARIGATWSGLGDANGAASGYGGKGNATSGGLGGGGGANGTVGKGGYGGDGYGNIQGGSISYGHVNGNDGNYGGGGAPGGNGGKGSRYSGASSGSSIILVSNKAKLSDVSISTGGANSTAATRSGGGGGTGFCYMSIGELIDDE